MTAAVTLDSVTVRYGDLVAVKGATLEIGAGEFFSFLGPSGCGKTTLLRVISGFVTPTSGRVLIDGADMAGIGANRRPTALIFQNLALFPLMTVAENIGYGLKVRGVPRRDREAVVGRLLELIALPGQGGKRIEELSGGQKQRVAIARALAVEPRVLLLDEPLSALDLKLRQHMRNELRAIQRRVGITFVYITHDQGEALSMSDRVAVMSRGVIEQIGAPREVYDKPRTAFVASFVGESNALGGRVTAVDDDIARVETALGPVHGRNLGALAQGATAVLFVRPEAMTLRPGPAHERLAGRAVEAAFEGGVTHLTLAAASGLRLTATLGREVNADLPADGAEAVLGFDARDAVVLPPEATRA
jgi:spermidine/putrescine transport system ATP-binding protein